MDGRMVDALFLSSYLAWSWVIMFWLVLLARSFMKEHALSHALSYGSRSYVRKSNPEHNDNARKKCTQDWKIDHKPQNFHHKEITTEKGRTN